MTLWIVALIFLLILIGYIPTIVRKKDYQLALVIFVFCVTACFLLYIWYTKIMA